MVLSTNVCFSSIYHARLSALLLLAPGGGRRGHGANRPHRPYRFVGGEGRLARRPHPSRHRHPPARHHRAAPASPAQAISAGKVQIEPRGNTRESAATNRRRAGYRESAAINRRRAEPPRIRCHQRAAGGLPRIRCHQPAAGGTTANPLPPSRQRAGISYLRPDGSPILWAMAEEILRREDRPQNERSATPHLQGCRS